MFAKIFLFCAVVAAAKATSFYGSAVIAPRHMDSRQQDFMWTQGIMNPITATRTPFATVPVGTAVASAFATRSAPLSRSMMSNPSGMSTQRSVSGTSGLLSGPSFMYSKGLLTNGIMGAASGIVSPMNGGLLVEPNVIRNILK